MTASNLSLRRLLTQWLAILTALVTAGLVLVWWRRSHRGTVVEAVNPAVAIPEPVAIQALAPPQAQPAMRWLLYLGGALVCVGLLAVLETLSPEIASVLFTLTMTVTLVYGVFRSADKIGVFIRGLQQALRYPRIVVQRYGGVLSFGAMVSALVLALFSAVLFWDSHAYDELIPEAFKLCAASLVAVWIALILRPNNLPIATIEIDAVDMEPAVEGVKANTGLFLKRLRTRTALFIAIILFFLLSEVNGQFIKSDLATQVSIHAQFVMLVVGTVLLMFGLTGVRAAALPSRSSWHYRLREWWPLGVIVALALVLRFWHLDTAMRFLVDERSFIDGIYGITDYPFAGLLQPMSSIAAFPNIFPYWQVWAMRIFGMNFIGLRATSAFLGILTVVAVYFLARELFDRKTALLAALLLATFPPHLQFSRIGINNIADPLFGTLALAFLIRGLQRQRRSDFVWSGIMLGFTQYFYEGGRLLYVPLVLVVLVGGILFARIRAVSANTSHVGAVLLRFRRSTRSVWLLLAAFVIIALPIYVTLAGMQRPALARLVDNGLGLERDYWQQILLAPDGLQTHLVSHIVPALEMYFNGIDTTFFYSKTTSLLLSGMLPFVILGFACACYYWRKPGPLLLIVWIIAAVLGNSLLKDSTSSTRFVVVFPALVLLAALGVRFVVSAITRHPRGQTVLLVGGGLLLAAYQTNFYFNQHLPEYDSIVRTEGVGPDGYDAAWRSIHFPPNTDIHLISTPIYNPIEMEGLVRVYRSDMHVDTLLSRRFSPQYLERLTCGINQAFFVQKQDEKTIRLLLRYFKFNPPQNGTYEMGVAERTVLYFAPYNPNDGSLYSTYCKTHPAKNAVQ